MVQLVGPIVVDRLSALRILAGAGQGDRLVVQIE